MSFSTRFFLTRIIDFCRNLGLGSAFVVMLSSLIHVITPPSHLQTKDVPNIATHALENSMDRLLREVRDLFEAPLDSTRLYAMSEKLQKEFDEKLRSSNICMLPSYQHTLPTGEERGAFLALDVGGSTFRIALVQLTGKDSWRNGMHIKRMKNFKIDKSVRDLKGRAFFDWMAERIQDMLEEEGKEDRHRRDSGAPPLPMGLAWSFPIKQTSESSGALLPMGKGFMATHGVEGQDLRELIMHACRQRQLNVQFENIVNDSSATLLSQAYRDPSTRMSLILGTGTNAAVHLPVSALSKEKFGGRPQSWFDVATHVLVNTELSMYGKHVMPGSRWDDHLNETHALPDFQPLEQKVGGRYLGEIVRLILVEAIQTCGLFDGQMPERLQEPYALDTGVIAVFESDATPSLTNACTTFQKVHPLGSPPSLTELHFVRHVSKLVSNRAAGYLATAVHALWSLRLTVEGIVPDHAGHVTIACNGSVMEKYPAFLTRCQQYLDELTVLSGSKSHAVTLEMAPESSVFGAAVAVSCMADR